MKISIKLLGCVLGFSLSFAWSVSLAVTTEDEIPTNVAGAIILNESDSVAKLDKKKIEQIFYWINEVSLGRSKLTKTSIRMHFSPNVHYSVNGKLLAKNSTELKARFEKLLSMYQAMSVSLPVEQIVTAKNSAAVSYRINIKKSDHRYYADQVIAILKFKNGRITNWQAVVSHQG